jgi:heptosyltransferase-2
VTNDSRQLQPKTIVVFCPNWVGDVVMATPAFDCIRQGYPRSRLIAVIRGYVKKVIEDAPWFDGIVEADDKTLPGFYQLVGRIRRLDSQIAIVFPNSLRAVLTARLGGAKKVYGYRRNGRGIFISGGPLPRRQARRVVPEPMTAYYLGICRWLGLAVDTQKRPRLYISDSLQQKGRQILKRYGIPDEDMLIGLNPGARFGSSKCWPPEHFSRLAELLAQRWNCKLLLFIGPGEEPIANAITRLSRVEIINTAPELVDLAVLKPLIQRCRLLVTNDTGPRHYAVAFDVPVVVIMGPTDPRYTDSNLEKTIVLRRKMDCSPCHLKKCPQDHRCMTEITPEAVLHASEKLLQEQA